MSAIMPAPTLLSAARYRGLKVGVFGGSFDPAHVGHLNIAIQALRVFKLDVVWWMVTPGNPLKTRDARGDMAARVAGVQQLIAGQPRMVATDIEAQMGTRYAIDTVMGLLAYFPDTEFVWIAGMDNAVHFTRWQKWQDLPLMMPFAFFGRPPALDKLKVGRVRQHKGIAQYTQFDGTLRAGIYWILHGQTLDISSSALRYKSATRHKSG